MRERERERERERKRERRCMGVSIGGGVGAKLLVVGYGGCVFTVVSSLTQRGRTRQRQNASSDVWGSSQASWKSLTAR